MTNPKPRFCCVCFNELAEPGALRCAGCSAADAARNGHPAPATTKTSRRGAYNR